MKLNLDNEKQAGESGGRERTKQASDFSAATDNNRIEWKNIQNIIKERKAQGLLYTQMYNNYKYCFHEYS